MLEAVGEHFADFRPIDVLRLRRAIGRRLHLQGSKSRSASPGTQTGSSSRTSLDRTIVCCARLLGDIHLHRRERSTVSEIALELIETGADADLVVLRTDGGRRIFDLDGDLRAAVHRCE